MPAFRFLESLARNLGEPYPTRTVTEEFLRPRVFLDT